MPWAEAKKRGKIMNENKKGKERGKSTDKERECLIFNGIFDILWLQKGLQILEIETEGLEADNVLVLLK